MVRELVKDLENMKGAVASNYKTFPVAYGETKHKKTVYFFNHSCDNYNFQYC